jgi:hypothetical protein
MNDRPIKLPIGPVVRERRVPYFAGATLLFSLAFLFVSRAYALFLAQDAGPSPASGIPTGFLEDSAIAACLALLTLLAFAAGKRAYFTIVFPLKILVVLTSYANLKYVNFYRENIRLFDLEYIQNMGSTWKETLRDLWVRPYELLFLIVPLAALAIGGLAVHRAVILRTAGKKLVVLAVVLAAITGLAFLGGVVGKRGAETGDPGRDNVWVGFIRDIPRLETYFRTVREIRAKTAGSEMSAPASHPFPLSSDEVWYGGGYPYIKIPKRDASRMGIANREGRPSGTDLKKRTRPIRNVVFLILESFRCREIGAFGGAYSLTPNFDALASRGTLFTDFYGPCDRTAGAQFSALNSFYDCFKGKTVMREHDRISLFSLPEILNLFGYSNIWVNSWPASFDNSRDYFKRHGNFAIIDKPFFPPTAAKAGFSYGDEDIVKMAVKTMDESRKPFFAIVLTATNHLPWAVPDKRFERDLESGVFGRYLNTFHYTDFALGRFFDMVREKDYFNNTIFFIFADTGNNRTKGGRATEFELCENEFHIPLLIYDPADEKGRVVSEIAGQVDIAPTVLDMLDIHIANPFIGRSLLKKSVTPFYLAYRGRNNPQVWYYDEISFCAYNTAENKLRVYDRKNGRPIDLPQDRRRQIVTNIETTLDLGDWAIYNDRIWDPKINDFYKSLFEKD